MSTAVAAVVAGLAGLASVVLGDLISAEVAGRLEAVPARLIRLAARRLAADVRQDCAAEWTAELHAILHRGDADRVPVARLLAGLRFALGTLRAARLIDRDLRSPTGPAAGWGSAITDAVRDATAVSSRSPRLVTDLVQAEIIRMSTFLSQLRDGVVTYDGEDQDWLLGLARSATASLDATSVTPAGGPQFWTSEIGERYLAAQRAMTTRGVAIRRVFLLERPELLDDPALTSLYRRQVGLGIRVRLLPPALVPPHRRGDLVDFIVFDGSIAYETLPGGVTSPGAHCTRLYLGPDQVADRSGAFEELWAAAVEPG